MLNRIREKVPEIFFIIAKSISLYPNMATRNDTEKDINEAYRVLSNPVLKKKYDRTWNFNVGHKQKKLNRKTSGEVAGEFFNMFFGNNESKDAITQSNEPAVKGNTSQTARKKVTLETGFELEVPLFIEEGDKIIVNVNDGSYCSRA